MTARSSTECPWVLKCAATGLSSTSDCQLTHSDEGFIDETLFVEVGHYLPGDATQSDLH